jgi:pyruvate ferredoxin oxidoreductase gamma subunit
VLGYRTAPIGGVIPQPGNTISNDLSTSRTGWMPLFNAAECIHCGLCATVCPDYCLVWTHEDVPAGAGEAGNGGPPRVRLRGVDYQYCKGCMRCIESCPTEALTRVTETPGLADRLRVPLFAGGPRRAELARK